MWKLSGTKISNCLYNDFRKKDTFELRVIKYRYYAHKKYIIPYFIIIEF